MLVKLYAAAVNGIDAQLITIEVNLTQGFQFSMVGLPDNAVKESKDRIFTAIQNSDMFFPKKNITINLAPADVRKEGSGYDLPIAVGLLAANGTIEENATDGCLIMGELSLDGSVREINASLSIAIMAKELGFKKFILPKENALEAAIVEGLEVYGVESLKEVALLLNGQSSVERVTTNTQGDFFEKRSQFSIDFHDVCGQEQAKKAFEVAVAGGHNIIMVGSPGCGKSMLAQRVPTIMPKFTFEEALETTKIHSVAGLLGENKSLMTTRPYRSPHNNVSSVALLGGGSVPKPGEISLAHNGVLFLDELPQYNKSALEELRQPLEEGKICISRAKLTAEYPANFILVAAMNPCPCGYYGNRLRQCTCTQNEVVKYMNKISGPLLDRIDIQIELQPVEKEKLMQKGDGETSEQIRERVEAARKIQRERFKNEPGIHCNAQMEKQHCDKYCNIAEKATELLDNAMVKLQLSARAYVKILKLSRTIADLDNSETVEWKHMKQALSYRNLDRATWTK